MRAMVSAMFEQATTRAEMVVAITCATSRALPVGAEEVISKGEQHSFAMSDSPSWGSIPVF